MPDDKTSGRYEETIKFCDDWTIKFLNSPYCKDFDEEQRWLCPYIILNFVESMYIYFDLIPKEWNKEALEQWCFSILPNKVYANESFFDAISPVLTKFFSFLHDKQVITNDLNLNMGLFLLKDKLKNVPINPEI